jgi:hypothetical protein
MDADEQDQIMREILEALQGINWSLKRVVITCKCGRGEIAETIVNGEVEIKNRNDLTR